MMKHIQKEPLIRLPSFLDFMSNYSFTGQRADKIKVVDSSVERVEDGHGMVKNGVVKEIEHYTISCDECGGTGYYDELGEVICDGCGMVLSGDNKPVLPVDYTNSRGFSEYDGDHPKGTMEISI